VTSFSTKSFKGTPPARQAVRLWPDSCYERGRYARDALNDKGCRAVGGRGRGESRRSWRGSLARCL